MFKEHLISVGVVSAGALGSAVADISAGLGHDTTAFFPDPDALREFQRTRVSKRLGGIKLSKDIRATDNLEEAVAGKDIVIVAVPSRVVHLVLEQMLGGERPLLSSNSNLVIGTKGLIKEVNSTISTFILKRYPSPDLVDRIAIWSGPNKAEELVKRKVTGTVIAAYNPFLIEQLQRSFSASFLRIYASDDPVGVEACGALKNVYAFGIGVARGLGVAGNSEALFYTRALAEMSRLVIAMGAASEETVRGLAGTGDLYLSCIQEGTRNRRAGEEFAKGKTIEQISRDKEIEAFSTIPGAYAFARERRIDAPIVSELFNLLRGKDVKECIRQLMDRKLTKEDIRFNPRTAVGSLSTRVWYKLRGAFASLI